MSVSFKSLRNQGYTLAESLAELVDNSIKAQAKNVEIYLYFADDPFILTVDDGFGMDENEIENKALVVPDDNSEYEDSGPDDLGRYGLGLKQGTFAHCKSLTILSKKVNFSYKSQHIDQDQPNESLPKCVSNNSIVKSKIEDLKKSKSGTIILWTELDNLMKRTDSTTSNFYDHVERTQKHFRMIYYKRILKNKLNLFFQGSEDINRLKPIDPFYEHMKETIKLEDIPINLKGSQIILKPFIIPKDISIENFNKNGNELQGLYFSRKDRIIDFGGWFEIDSEFKTRLSTTDKYRRLRILIELPVKNIEDWIPSQKNKVNIPDFFKKPMFQIVVKIRDKYLDKINEE
jgi:hypothetical protein